MQIQQCSLPGNHRVAAVDAPTAGLEPTPVRVDIKQVAAPELEAVAAAERPGRLGVQHELAAEFLDLGQFRRVGVFILPVVAAPQQQVKPLPGMTQAEHRARRRSAVSDIVLRLRVHEAAPFAKPGLVEIERRLQRSQSRLADSEVVGLGAAGGVAVGILSAEVDEAAAKRKAGVGFEGEFLAITPGVTAVPGA